MDPQELDPDGGGLDQAFKDAQGGESAEAEGGAPLSAPTGKAPPSADEFMSRVWPLLEKMLVTTGGEHWKLSEEEKATWFGLMGMAYPEFDPGRFAKPAFWLITASIFGPRLIISVGIAVGKARGNEERPSDGVSDDPREEGEREDLA